MATESDNPQDTANPETLPENITPTSTTTATPNIDVTPPQSKDVVPKKDVETLLAKVRQEEKGKLYPEIEKLKTRSIELQTTNKTLEEQLQERQQEVEELRAGKLGELTTVNKELNDLRETNKKLSDAIENVATEAAGKIRGYELSSYRERRIRETGLKQLHDMVTGTNKEEIEASLTMATSKEVAIFEKAKEEALAELAKDLPQPIAPDGSQGRDVISTLTPQKRNNIVKLNNDEYQTQRAELLAEAKRKAGM